MQAYLDNSATTVCEPGVVEKVVQMMSVAFGNPSAMHNKGVEAENYVKEAKEIIAKTMKVQEKEILFTSGGTESNNMAIMGCAAANHRMGKHLITTRIEHPSVGNVMKHMEEEGYEVTYLPVDENGIVKLDKLQEALRPDTMLVSVMYVNNEIGAVQPIEEISKIVKANNKATLFHVDAIQAYGKYRIFPKKMGIDLLSVSGHKIHGPKGVGFLYCDAKVKIKPIIFGGGQQKDLRSGTENVPGIVGLAEAAKEIYTDFEAKIEHLYEVKAHFVEEISKLEGVKVNGLTGKDSAPHVVSVSFPGVRSEVLLHSLEEREVYASAGSACSSNKPAVSATLKAINVPKEHLDSTLRFSFSVHTTKEEIDYCIEVLKELLPMLRKYARH
ncbi:MAG: cysteine desulfurase family protein [Lachnospiraceae bacterium]|nr:cysteine desulfurase family protein [Lachnospiraceae bacterium]